MWQGENGNTSPDPNITPDPGNTNITPSAHLIMAIIAPWTEPLLAYLNRKELPEDRNEARYIVQHSKAYKVHDGELYKKSPPESFNDVYPRKRGGNSWLKFMPDSAVATPQLGPLLARPSVQGFIFRRPERMQRTLSNIASDANSLPIKAICPHCPTNNPHHLAFHGLGT